MSIENILGSESGLTLVGSIIGGVWTLFKSTEYYGRFRRRRYNRALRALEAGVEKTYRAYVREIKRSRADGKLTEDEKLRARNLALDTAFSFGRTQGINVANELGEEYLNMWLEKIVNRLKYS